MPKRTGLNATQFAQLKKACSEKGGSEIEADDVATQFQLHPTDAARILAAARGKIPEVKKGQKGKPIKFGGSELGDAARADEAEARIAELEAALEEATKKQAGK